METKFGTATINNGYYQISTRKEGNHKKYLHILVWEDFYGKSIPEGYVIHHLNRDKTDNRIQNLQCCKASEHTRFHGKDTKHSQERKDFLSERWKRGGNPRYRNDLDNEKLYQAYLKTNNYCEVGRMFNCNEGTVRRRVNKYKKENGL